MFEVIADTIFSVGLTLGVGSSTFALIFYIRSLEDGVVNETERRFMHTVYSVLRIGMALILFGLVATSIARSTLALGELILVSIITLNAVLMTYRRMPMQIGPVLAGGTWYALFLYAKTPLGAVSPIILTFCYAVFLFLLYGIFQYFKKRFTSVKGVYGGDVVCDAKTLDTYSEDASSFKLLPQAVYYPRNVNDIQAVIQMCHEARKTDPRASLTVRAGGTCMSGGSLNTGWIVDMTKHMRHIEIDPDKRVATVAMGAYFRDIEDAAIEHNLMFAPYPSSHRICGIGGMLGNNASGEKSLRCGATSDNVLELEVVLADGTVERIAPKPRTEITHEREKSLHALYVKFGEKLKKATGNVKKSASGYRLEKIVNGDIFNPVPLFVGAQGTLGIITKAVLKLTPIPKHTELLIISASSLKDIPKVIETIYKYNPECIETFDKNTFAKAKKHLKDAALRVMPYVQARSHLVILAQFSEVTDLETVEQAKACLEDLVSQNFDVHHVTDVDDVKAAWEIRRNSFLLIRDHTEQNFKAVPCIEDVIVPLSELGRFITELRKILKRQEIQYGYHGHIGDGSLRIIPVFDFTKPTVGEDITALMDEVFALVKRLKGNISADHSDGIVRTPYLEMFYGKELYDVFGEIKNLYDPTNIMNPHKKVGGSVGLLKQCLNCNKI